jgi:hypothetical protein
MSSHHFVKEGQEPALFILDEVSLQVIEPLLEWVPLIVVADDIVDHALQWGIKIDVVLQHFHSVELLQEKLQGQLPIHILPGTGKVITRGLQFLNDSNQSSVNLAITTPTEDIIREIESVANLLQVSIYSGREKWLYVTSCKFEKWMDEGQIISIRSDPAMNVETKGLMRYGSGWQTTHSGLVTLESKAPFWIRECL